MAKQIKGTDIIEPRHLQEAYEQAVQLKNGYIELNKAVLTASTSLKNSVKGVKGNSVAEISAINNAYRESQKVKQASITVTAQLAAAEDEEVKAKLRWQQASATQNKLLREEIALQNKELGTLPRLTIENNKLRRERETLNLETKKGSDRLREINLQLNKNNEIIRKSSDTLKQQKLNVGNYGSAVNKLTGALGQLGLAFSAFTIMRDAFKTVVDFEKATASLSAITGAVGDDLTDLKGKVMDLATEMKISATDATKLFEIVGSQMPQLLKDADGLQKVAESAVILSKASGDTVEESTRALANVMNQFSLGADQAERAMNILAAGSLVGSAGIADVSEAMKNFGSVAAGANISVEESVALIEVLGKFGVIGAESGTKLRGSILKLQQASFGYASGQFEVNDALEEAKKKMDSYGTALEQDAFLQKTFGAENISTGRILLANIGLFEEYTKGVTGTSVATDQAAINSDTMATVVKELRAAWENLIIKWSEGTDVLGGVKTVLRFVSDNLETIVTWVFKGMAAWAAYRIGLMLVNKEGTGLIQVFGNMIKGMAAMAAGTKSLGSAMKSVSFAGWLSILTVLIPMLWKAGKEIYNMFVQTTALDKVTDKYNAKMDEERVKMDLLKVRILDAIGNKTKMIGLIKEINATYGTTLKNIEDETLMMAQLEQAYRQVNAEMEKRIMHQILNEELTDAFRRKREAEKALKDSAGSEDVMNLLGFYNAAEDDLKKAKDDIEALRLEMARLNLGMESIGSTAGSLGKLGSLPTDLTDTFRSDGKEHKAEVEFKFPEPEELKDQVNEGWDSFLDAWKKREHAEIEIDPEDVFVDPEIGDIIAEKIIETEEEIMARRRKMAEESINLARKITDAQIEQLQRKIDLEKTEIAASEDKIDYLREQAKLVNADAAASIKAEEIAKANNQLEVNRLEKRKAGLLATITVLELASQKINAGDNNAMGNAGNELAQLIAKIPKFIDGTDTTVAAALGQPQLSGKDGYIIRADGSEMILNPEQSAKLNGLNTDQITNGALAYHSNISGLKSMRYSATSSDQRIVNELKQVKDAIKGIDIPEHHFRYDEQNKALVDTVKWRSKIINNHYKTGGLFS